MGDSSLGDSSWTDSSLGDSSSADSSSRESSSGDSSSFVSRGCCSSSLSSVSSESAPSSVSSDSRGFAMVVGDSIDLAFVFREGGLETFVVCKGRSGMGERDGWNGTEGDESGAEGGGLKGTVLFGL